MSRTRFALILFFRMVAHKASCHTLSKVFFFKSMKTWYRFCWWWRLFFTQDSKVEDLFCGASSGSEPSLFFSKYFFSLGFKSRKENPQKLTQLSSRSHPRHLVGKRTAQKDITIDTTSDSQVNSNFPNRWSPASLTFNNYFYLCLYLYITWITTNNNAPHLKSPKNQSRRTALGRPAIKFTGGLQLVFGRPTLALSSALVPQTLSCLVCVEDS